MSSRFSSVPPTVADRLRHILHSIEEIQGLLADASQQEFADNRLLCLAVERLLEFVREASRHIPAEAKERTPEIPWRRIADLGNRLRHAYHQINSDLLWFIAKDDLPPLRAVIERLMAQDRA
jgi:uncharacterized protein with HEPN domain